MIICAHLSFFRGGTDGIYLISKWRFSSMSIITPLDLIAGALELLILFGSIPFCIYIIYLLRKILKKLDNL